MNSSQQSLGARLGAALLVACAPLVGCESLQDLAGSGAFGDAEPRLEEMVAGLKQALSKGAGEAIAQLARDGGFQSDALVRIPFPEEARFAADGLRKVGLGGLVDSFEKRLNRGAEAGAQRALPILEDAIRGMSFADARQVLLGGEHAATDFFRERTYDALVTAFRPELQRALDDVGATDIWADLGSRYNALPFTSQKVDTDIVHYATGRALDGVFVKLAAEEARIRADPVARTTALLQKVFGYAQSRS